MAATNHIWVLGEHVQGFHTLLALNDANKGIGCIMLASQTGTISQIEVYCGNAQSPPVYRFALESVNSSGYPSGSLLDTDTYVDHTPAYGLTTLSLIAGASVTLNQPYAVTVRYLSGTVGGLNTSSMAYSGPSGFFRGTDPGFPSSGTTTNGGASWGFISSPPALIPIYSNGDKELLCNPGSFTGVGFSLGGGGNMSDLGCEFVAPMTCQVIGGLSLYGQPAGTTIKLRLYDSSDTLLAEGDMLDSSSASGDTQIIYFGSPPTITETETYRLVLSAVSGAIAPTQWESPSAWAPTRLHAGAMVSRTSGVWSLNANRYPIVVPLVGSPAVTAGSVLFSSISKTGRVVA